MKHSHRSFLAIVPLLSVLSLSPQALEKYHSSRNIASINEVASPTPKLDALASKIDRSNIVPDRNLTVDQFKSKSDQVHERILKSKEEFKKDQSDKTVVNKQRELIEDLVTNILLIEIAQSDSGLQEKLQEDQLNASKQSIKKSKDILEGLISDLQRNENLVAEAEKARQAPTQSPSQASNIAQEDKKANKPSQVCPGEEQNKVLTAQVQELVKQNDQIMKTMLGLIQVMISMNQRQMYQSSPFQIPNPYVYNQPSTAGNWVYYPQGVGSQGQNIFNQPSAPSYAPQVNQGYYPDNFYQPQNNWMLRPEYNLDPRYQSTPVMMGTFGMNNFFYNLEQNLPSSQMTPSPQLPPGVLKGPQS
jgi:hypothetical protein